MVEYVIQLSDIAIFSEEDITSVVTLDYLAVSSLRNIIANTLMEQNY